MNHKNNKKTANISNTSNKDKSLLVVNPIFPSKSLGNKVCLIYCSIVPLDLVLIL